MKSRRKTIKSLVLVGLVLVFALSLVSQAEAQQRRLRGEYAVVGEQQCVCHWLVNPDNPGNPSATVYWTSTSTVLGTTIFHGNGTGSVQVSLHEVTHPIYTPIPLYPIWVEPSWPFPLPPSILGQTITSDISLQFSYVLSADGAITRTITPDTATGVFTSGPLGGKTYTFTPFTLNGFVSRNRETILYASVPGQPDIITVDIFNEDGSLYGRQEQECTRSRVLTYIGR
jgi:hypothetical protein